MFHIKKMKGQTILYFVALFLIVVGALNWGYIALTKNCENDLISAVVPPDYVQWVYAAVGVSGLVLLLLIMQRNAFDQGASLKSNLRAVRRKAGL